LFKATPAQRSPQLTTFRTVRGGVGVIETAQSIPRHRQDRQFHLRGQIADEIIGPNRDEPASHAFHKNAVSAFLKCSESAKQKIDIDLDLFYQCGCKWRGPVFLTRVD